MLYATAIPPFSKYNINYRPLLEEFRLDRVEEKVILKRLLSFLAFG